jgi:hypothetical protein
VLAKPDLRRRDSGSIRIGFTGPPLGGDFCLRLPRVKEQRNRGALALPASYVLKALYSVRVRRSKSISEASTKVPDITVSPFDSAGVPVPGRARAPTGRALSPLESHMHCGSVVQSQ